MPSIQQPRDRAGDERRLRFHDGVIDRSSEPFVQDLDTEDLGAGGCAVLVRGSDGDIKGQNLIRVPGKSKSLEALDFRERNRIQIFDRGVHWQRDVADGGRVEDARLISDQLVVDLELRTDVIDVGQCLNLQVKMCYIIFI